MSTLELLHKSAIDARDEYTALVLAEAKGEAEERDAQSVRELLAIVGKTAAELERDIATARQRYNAAKDFQRAGELRAEADKLKAEAAKLKAERDQISREHMAIIDRAYAAHAEVDKREKTASNEAINLRSRANQIMQETGASATTIAGEFQRRINEVLGSVAFDRAKLTGQDAKDAKATIDELTPTIERLERRIKSGGPAADRDELAKAREKFDKATATLAHIETLKPIVATADKRALELEAEKQAALDNPPGWDEIDFFADVPNEVQRFGRPCLA